MTRSSSPILVIRGLWVAGWILFATAFALAGWEAHDISDAGRPADRIIQVVPTAPADRAPGTIDRSNLVDDFEVMI